VIILHRPDFFGEYREEKYWNERNLIVTTGGGTTPVTV
jgi:hypothetical protein